MPADNETGSAIILDEFSNSKTGFGNFLFRDYTDYIDALITHASFEKGKTFLKIEKNQNIEKEEIRKQVNSAIEKWSNLQKKRRMHVIFSQKVIDFFCLMIENIEDDRSTYWDYDKSESNNAQQFAITLIPNALNELTEFRRYLRFQSKVREIHISTWEIWHSLSEIINKFCAYIRFDFWFYVLCKCVRGHRRPYWSTQI